MSRALLIVLDSVGCGAAPDASSYGDAGANTLSHIVEAVPNLQIPTLKKLGWSQILEPSARTDSEPKIETAHEAFEAAFESAFAVLSPKSVGKDTTSGHWELAGAILDAPFATFQSFPPALVAEIERAASTQFIGNITASGTQVLEVLGEQSVVSGRPILYTSADSVLQIAAHEHHFGLEKLLEVCEIARKIVDKWQIGRVIARPFVGEIGNWTRTTNRRDFSIAPPRTVLDALLEAKVTVTGIGKISDIFAGRGFSRSLPSKSNASGMEIIECEWKNAANELLFANLVDFDTLYGHRRDVLGYARALEEFDEWFSGFLPQISDDDLVIVTADHGNDPTFPGTDHTRENVPLLLFQAQKSGDLGRRNTFADVAATLAAFFATDWHVGNAL